MKTTALVIFLIIISAGCLDEKLSPGEARECLLSTSTQPSTIPSCDSARECEKIFNENFPNKEFQTMDVGIENIAAKKGISAAWHRLNTAAKSNEKIHQACSDAEIKTILSYAVTAAAELQGAIKGSEDAQLNTYSALEKSIQHGSKLALEEVKDTDAFRTYVTLVQKASEIETGNPVSEWGAKQTQNKDYFDNISRVIANNKENPYEITWKSVFDAYKTGVIMSAGQKSRGIIALSPLWQGALSAVLGRSKSVNILSIVNAIKINEIILHTEEIVSPPNGLLLSTWKNIEEFEQKILELEKGERDLEKMAQTRLSEIKEKEILQKKENEAWEKIVREINAWNQIVFGKNDIVSEEIYFNNEIEKIYNEIQTLSLEKTLNEKPIGQRVKEWREIIRKIESAAQKIQERSDINEIRRKTCETIIQKVNTNESIKISDAENCQNEIKAINESAATQKETQMLISTSIFDDCLRELNEWESALEEDISKSEYFEYYYGKKGANDCESALANAKNRYETNAIVNEGEKLRSEIKKYEKILQITVNKTLEPKKSEIVRALQAAQETIMVKQKMSISDWKKKNSEWNQTIIDLETLLEETLNNIAQKTKWIIVQPTTLNVGEIQNVTWEGTLIPDTGQELDKPFIISAPNPGMNKIDFFPENTRVTIGEMEILVEGDIIPSGGITIRGSGEKEAANVARRQALAKVIGVDAIVEEKIEIKTDFFPLQVVLKKNILSREGLIKIKTDEKIVWPDESEEISILLKSNTTEVIVTRLEKNAISVQTQNQLTEIKWGKEYATYQITTTNRLPNEIEATVYTGVNGDPTITLAVHATNENGEEIPTRLDASGNIILQNQIIEGKSERKYVILIERWEGSEEWGSIIERLISEAKNAGESPNTALAREADKIISSLIALQSKANSSEIYQKIPIIQNQISKLIEVVKLDNEEWNNREKNWAQIRMNAPKEFDEWIRIGDSALEARDEKKLEETMKKIADEKQQAPVQKDANNNSIEKLNQAKELISSTLKKIEEYDKSISVGCDKLASINYICPISEKQLGDNKKNTAEFQKIYTKMELKTSKLNAEQMNNEWNLIENEWSEKENRIIEINEKTEDALRLIRNASVERIEKINYETKNSTNEEVLAAIEKASGALDEGEFGKSIFISQNMLNYVSGNRMSGLLTIVPAAWPFIGIIAAVGAWLAWKEWKRKKNPEIKKIEIPKGKIITREDNQLNENERPTKQEESQSMNKAEAWKEIQEPTKWFEEIVGKNPPEERKKLSQQKRK